METSRTAVGGSLKGGVSRRRFLGGLFWAAAGLSLGCSPIKLIIDVRREKVFEDHALENKTLRAFIGAVVPGVNLTNQKITNPFSDPFYRFLPYRSVFINDLNKRAFELKSCRFEELGLKDQSKVINQGLKKKLLFNRIYGAAIFIAQLTVYTGVATGDNKCEMIHFTGPYNFEPTTYRDYRKYIGIPATTNGYPD